MHLQPLFHFSAWCAALPVGFALRRVDVTQLRSLRVLCCPTCEDCRDKLVVPAAPAPLLAACLGYFPVVQHISRCLSC